MPRKLFPWQVFLSEWLSVSGLPVAVGVRLAVAIGGTFGVGLTAAVGAAAGIWLAAAVGLAVVF